MMCNLYVYLMLFFYSISGSGKRELAIMQKQNDMAEKKYDYLDSNYNFEIDNDELDDNEQEPQGEEEIAEYKEKKLKNLAFEKFGKNDEKLQQQQISSDIKTKFAKKETTFPDGRNNGLKNAKANPDEVDSDDDEEEKQYKH